MKKIKYFRTPKLWKYGIPAIILYYFIRYYESIELYKYFLVGVPLIAIIILKKRNQKYIEWNSNIIKFKTPDNDRELQISTKDISSINIDNNAGIYINMKDSTSHFITFKNLGSNGSGEINTLKQDFRTKFSNLIIETKNINV